MSVLLDENEYKIVRIKLIPFIFTEKYEQVKGFIKYSHNIPPTPVYM